MSTALVQVTAKLAERFGIEGNEADIFNTLKATAFKGNVSNEQFTALMIVANQYGLNPFTKEIYAFPDKNNGIVPVVGVDGWARIMNDHPQFDGLEYEQDDDGCTCVIYRKDRNRPVKVTEYMAECRRDTAPWKSHPRRMLRHKATIQAARLAFGFVGIYDEDEAERIVSAPIRDMGTAQVVARAEPAAYPDEAFVKNFPAWEAAIQSGKKTPDAIIAMVSSKATLTDEQVVAIREVAAIPSAAEEDAPF